MTCSSFRSKAAHDKNEVEKVGYDDVMKYTNLYRDIISIIKLNLD